MTPLRRTRFLPLVPILIGAVALIANPGLAEEPTPAPTARPTPIQKNRSLADVARGLRLTPKSDTSETSPKDGTKSGTSKKGPTVITNETIAENAGKGHITTANPATPAGPPLSSSSDDDKDSKREAWRKKYKEQLQLVADIEAEIAALDLEIPKLWSDFYAWDDPAYRDNVIKPRLDQALIKRDELEQTLEKEKANTPQIIEDARHDGALPGWFRDLK